VPAAHKKTHCHTGERIKLQEIKYVFEMDGAAAMTKGVDFGIWKNINLHSLICPVDVHVARVAKRLGLLQSKQTDWMLRLN
jgi:hypothetical protein